MKITPLGGTIVFLGSVNAMPMMYALELKKLGFDVIYLVNTKEPLHRPEHHFSKIKYPYPDWIIECIIYSELLISIVPKLFAKKVKNILSGKSIQAIVAGGHFISLFPCFEDKVIKIILSYGADIEFLCNKKQIGKLQEEYRYVSFTKFLPRILSDWLIESSVNNCFLASQKSNFVIFFPKGLSLIGDEVINDLESIGCKYISRYDISFDIFSEVDCNFKFNNDFITIFSPVRFHFENKENENKGNDRIIEGISLFYKKHKKLKVIFYEKGPDVEKAKELCNHFGIAEIVEWRKPTSLMSLISEFSSSDICFDQVGNHWIGAIGIYATYLGKPLIANYRNCSFLEGSHIYQAEEPEDICLALIMIRDTFSETQSVKLKEYAIKHFSPINVLNKIIDFNNVGEGGIF